MPVAALERFVRLLAVLVLLVAAVPEKALGQVTPCLASCAELGVGEGTPLGGGVYRVPIAFAQAPSGGAADVTVLTLSLSIPGLRLSDCSSIDGDGRTPSVRVAESVADSFTVLVENTSCANRDHCLCPGEGQTRDEYVNVMVYGPKELPAPAPGGSLACDPNADGALDAADVDAVRRGVFRQDPPASADCNQDGLVSGSDVTAALFHLAGGPIDFPLLPSAEILSLDLRALPSAQFPVPLHVFAETDLPPLKPVFAAFAGIGDREGVDVTVDRASNQSRLQTVDGVIEARVLGIAGDCDGNAETGITELQLCANIFLGEALDACPACDADGDEQVDITDLQGAVNCFLDAEAAACPGS